LSECDEIILLENGVITAFGKYDELKLKIGKLSTFLENNYKKTFDEGILLKDYLSILLY
jgi:hypothetical protein